MNETYFLEIISGERKGFLPSGLRCLFRFLSFFYGIAIRIRNFLFNVGIKKTSSAKVPVVSIGNITTGGTGKTPFSAYLCHWFLKQGMKPVFLSRGYKSLDEESNDEKLVLEQLCPGVPHLQNRDRVSSAEKAVSDFQAEMILLDDGFQHRRLNRDLDIVLIDALNPWGHGYLLPRGLLREHLSGLKKADLIVITRADQVNESVLEKIVEQLKKIRGTEDHVRVAYPPTRLISINGDTEKLSGLHEKNIGAFCGIGNPEGFRKTLVEAGLNISWFKAFPDHFHFSSEDMKQIDNEIKEQGISAVLTTQKDLVKIQQSSGLSVPLFAVQIETKILAGEELLVEKLSNL